MLILRPYIHQTIWGGNKLNRYIDDNRRNGIGHLYTVRATSNDSNEIINKCNCSNLYQYFLKKKQKWNMQECKEFPISIALVDATQNLSVQVHPNKDKAEKYEQFAIGKNESFYLLEEPDCGAMINGCLCSDKNELIEKVGQKSWNEVIDYLEVREGDYVYVKAGTLHAMTKGALTYEIEESSPYTYRLYDYDRVDAYGNKRSLDTEKAIDCINVNYKSVAIKSNYQEFVEEKYSTQMIRGFLGMVNNEQKPMCITLLKGTCVLEGITVSPGMSIILEPGEKIDNINVSLVILAKIL